jgi:glycosyltransferase involved in cell wall biosynthesis
MKKQFTDKKNFNKEGKKITVFVPCFNEEKGIKRVMEKIPSFVDNVVVVDNASTDNTAKVAKKNKAIVLVERRRGKGNAFIQFLNYFSGDFDSDIVVMLDGDNTYDPNQIETLIEPIFTGSHVVMGDRLNSEKIRKVMSWPTYFGNKILSQIASILYSRETRDLCTGYWGFSREFLNQVDINAKSFDLEANLFTEAVNKNFNITTIPVKYNSRIGKSKLKYTHGFLIVWRLLKEKFKKIFIYKFTTRK